MENYTLLMGGIGMQESNIAMVGVSLCKKWGTIRIFRSTIFELGQPKYIRFLFNPQKEKLAVQSCEKKELECFRVPKNNVENWDFRINSLSMLTMIWKTCGWNDEKTYRLKGISYPEYNLIEFNLKQAKELETDEF